MNLVVLPFHDYRKSQNEGFRTRDGHIMLKLQDSSEVTNILIINRPFSLLEMLYKRKSWKTQGETTLKMLNKRLVKINQNTFVIDYLSFDILGQLLNGKKWFWKSYSQKNFIKFIKRSLIMLEIKSYNVISHTPQSYGAVSKLQYSKIIFDAFDNWLKIPANKKYYQIIFDSYQKFSKLADIWTTNSEENKKYYKKLFAIEKIEIITNGVDPDYFRTPTKIPSDLRGLKKPIIGFAGKITHLIDTELVNYILSQNIDMSFVFIGAILDKSVYDRITKADNFYFLGDKHYKEYPSYLNTFDVCIIPYNYGNKAHGGDSIKFYEYLAADKTIVSTPGNGVFKYNSNVFICNSKEDFSNSLGLALLHEKETTIIKQEITWEFKAEKFLSLLKS